MAELRYLKKVYPTVSAIDVVSALLAIKETTVCEDGLFVPLTLQGNRRLKLPTAHGLAEIEPSFLQRLGLRSQPPLSLVRWL